MIDPAARYVQGSPPAEQPGSLDPGRVPGPLPRGLRRTRVIRGEPVPLLGPEGEVQARPFQGQALADDSPPGADIADGIAGPDLDLIELHEVKPFSRQRRQGRDRDPWCPHINNEERYATVF
jgi:hypothetical protein